MTYVPLLSPTGEEVEAPVKNVDALVAQGYQRQTTQDLVDREYERTQGIAGKIYTGASRVASVGSLGLSDVALRAGTQLASGGEYSGQDFAQFDRTNERVNSGTAMAGTAVGLIGSMGAGALLQGGGRGLAAAGRALSPGLVEGSGLAALAARGGTALASRIGGTSALARAARAGVKLAVPGAAEGVAYGAGEGLAAVARSDAGFGNPALAAEQILASGAHGMLSGALLGGALGAGGSLLASGARGAAGLGGRLATKAGDIGAAGLRRAESVLPEGERILGRLGTPEGLKAVSREMSLKRFGAQKTQTNQILADGGADLLEAVGARAESEALRLEQKYGRTKAERLTQSELHAEVKASKARANDTLDETLEVLEREGSRDDLQALVDRVDEYAAKVRDEAVDGGQSRKIVDEVLDKITLSSKKANAINEELLAARQIRADLEAQVAKLAEDGSVDAVLNAKLGKTTRQEERLATDFAIEQKRAAEMSWRRIRETRKHVWQQGESAGSNVAKERVYKDLAGLLEDGVEQAALKSTGSEAYKAAKKSYRELSYLEKAATNAVSQQAGNQTMGLLSHLAGGTGAGLGAAAGSVAGPLGSAAGGVIGGVLGGVANKFAAGPRGRALAARLARQAAEDGGGSMAMLAQGQARQALDSAADSVRRSVAKVTRTSSHAVDRSARMAPRLAAAYQNSAKRNEEAQREAQNATLAADQTALAVHTPGVAGAVAVARMRASGAVRPPMSPSPVDLSSMADPSPVSEAEQSRYVRQTNAVREPLKLLRDASGGLLTTDEVEAVRAAYPELMRDIERRAIASAVEQAQRGRVPGYAQRIALSKLAGKAMDATLRPDFVAAMQATHGRANAKKTEAARATMRRANRDPKLAEQATTQTQKWY